MAPELIGRLNDGLRGGGVLGGVKCRLEHGLEKLSELLATSQIRNIPGMPAAGALPSSDHAGSDGSALTFSDLAHWPHAA